MSQFKMDCHALTEKGHKRVENQDHHLIADLVKAVRIQQTSLGYNDHSAVSGNSHGKILLVADGMGGHSAGRRAANLAIDETINYIVNRMQWYAFRAGDNDDADLQHLQEDLVQALKYCQNRIQDEAEWNIDRRGMGTTLTIGLVDWPMLHVVHVGDSRCYRLRGSELEQLTRDHTMAQVYQEAGRAVESAQEASHLKNTLWNVVGGTTTDLTPEIYSCRLQTGDKLLFCTDGLTQPVSDRSITNILKRNVVARQSCKELVAAALNEGAEDNITAVVARFSDNKAETPAEAESATLQATASPSITTQSKKEKKKEISLKDKGDKKTVPAKASKNTPRPNRLAEDQPDHLRSAEPVKAKNHSGKGQSQAKGRSGQSLYCQDRAVQQRPYGNASRQLYTGPPNLANAMTG